MGRSHLDQADADVLMAGTGQSERAFSKAIKRLVTKNYMTMDTARIYHLTQKGYKAIEDIAAYDLIAPPSDASGNQAMVGYDLAVVVPPGVVNAQQTATMMLGLEPLAGEALSGEATLILRLDMVGGEVEPREFSANLSAEMSVVMAQFSVTAQQGQAIRLRVEAFQSVNYDELEELGGMYFDVTLGETLARPKAYHATIEVAEQFF